MTTRLITGFCQQHRQINQILHKYWNLLSMDTTLTSLVSDQPQITFRRAPSLRDKLMYSKHKTKKSDHITLTRTFICGNCNYCQYMDTRKDVNLPNRERFKPKHFVNCRTAGVVYLLLCECGCYYVGKTKLAVW